MKQNNSQKGLKMINDQPERTTTLNVITRADAIKRIGILVTGIMGLTFHLSGCSGGGSSSGGGPSGGGSYGGYGGGYGDGGTYGGYGGYGGGYGGTYGGGYGGTYGR